MVSLMHIWDELLKLTKQEVGSAVVETWLRAIYFYHWDSAHHVAYLTVPNAFIKDWISTHYIPLIQEHLSRLLSVSDVKVIIFQKDGDATITENYGLASTDIAERDVKETTLTQLIKPARTYRDYGINGNYQFDTFVRGPNNQMAYAAAYAVAKKPGAMYNPFFIYGGSGVGKTHLLHAIANEISETQKKLSVLYQPAERFISEFVQAIKSNGLDSLHSRYKNIDVWLIDDIQSISHKQHTQEVFFNIFNHLYNAHKQIIFTGDSYPTHIHGLTERLRSRLAGGLVTDIQQPSFDTKVDIIRKKAFMYHQELSDDVVQYLATRSCVNIRELEGALIRCIAYTSLMKKPMSLSTVQAALLDMHSITATHQFGQFDIEKMLSLVGKEFNCTINDLRSKKKNKHITHARHVAMYLIKKYLKKSLHEIAHILRRTDHSTVIHAYKQTERRIEEDNYIAQKVRLLENKLFV